MCVFLASAYFLQGVTGRSWNYHTNHLVAIFRWLFDITILMVNLTYSYCCPLWLVQPAYCSVHTAGWVWWGWNNSYDSTAPSTSSRLSAYVFLPLCSHCSPLPDRRHSGREAHSTAKECEQKLWTFPEISKRNSCRFLAQGLEKSCPAIHSQSCGLESDPHTACKTVLKDTENKWMSVKRLL